MGLMDHLGVESRYHVAHDLGGLWTWELLMQDAESIKGLILLNTIIDSE
jgi:pimeloyl-ACP methyl ester carboxylesterase